MLTVSAFSYATPPIKCTARLAASGVTWFAWTEAKVSNVQELKSGAAVMLAGVLFILVLPLLAFLKAPKTEEGPADAKGAPKPDIHVEI